MFLVRSTLVRNAIFHLTEFPGQALFMSVQLNKKWSNISKTLMNASKIKRDAKRFATKLKSNVNIMVNASIQKAVSDVANVRLGFS